jgi:hypothetical protein
MPMTCAAAFNPKVWTCATTPRKPRCPSCFTGGITSPGAALCTARQNNNRTDFSRKSSQIKGLQGIEDGELILRVEERPSDANAAGRENLGFSRGFYGVSLVLMFSGPVG